MSVFYIPTANSTTAVVLKGDVTGPSSSTYLPDLTVTSKLLTGLVITPGIVTAADSIRTAVGKLAAGFTSITTNSIESLGTTLNIASANNTQILNLGSGTGIQTINVGNSGAGATTINLGGAGDTVTIAGTLTTINSTTTNVLDKTFVLNSGGLAASAGSSGVYFEEAGSSANSYMRVSSDRSKMELKAPTGLNLMLNQSLSTTDTPSFPSIKLTTAPALGKILSSDATGNSSWIANTGFATVPGSNNVVYGLSAGATLIGSSGDTVAIGHNAGSGLTSGQYNTAIGASILTASTTQSYNTAVGNGALGVSTSAGNTAVGFVAGSNISSGGFNTTIGCQAGQSMTTNTNCVALGYLSDMAVGLTNSTVIGNHAFCSVSNTIQLGNAAVTNVNTSGSVTASSFVSSGAITAPSITFPSGTLSYYTEYSHVTNMLWNSVAVPITVKLTRIGRQVSAYFPATSWTSTGANSTNIVMSLSFPAQFKAAAVGNLVCYVSTITPTASTANGCANFDIYYGSCTIFSGVQNTLFTSTASGQAVGFDSFSLTWSI